MTEKKSPHNKHGAEDGDGQMRLDKRLTVKLEPGKSLNFKKTTDADFKNISDLDDDFDRTIATGVDFNQALQDAQNALSDSNERLDQTIATDVDFVEAVQNNEHTPPRSNTVFDQTIATDVDFDQTTQHNQSTENKPDFNLFERTIDVDVDVVSHKVQTSEIRLIGRYHATTEIGSGGYGTVYKGFDPKLGREIAIKTIRFDKSLVEEIEFFEKEAKTLAQCNHPNIVQVYDVGRHNNNPYIVMEFVNGPDICEYMEKQRAEKDIKHIQKMVCSNMMLLTDALAYLHKHKIYHQDIKPKNILVSLNNHCAKLVDFGLAIENPNAQHSEDMSGTYAYMPPEKFEGKSTAKMNDIYALGAVFFEMLTGRPAHPGKTNTEVVQHVLSAEVTFTHEDGIDEQLRNICLKCLKNDSRERYQDISQIYNDLVQYSGNAVDINEYPYLLLTVDEKKLVFPLTCEKNFIGRTFVNQIVIPDVTISRTQALIELGSNRITMKNLSEVNKIKVNDADIGYEKEIELTGHEKIEIAGYTFHLIPRSEVSEYKEIVVDTEDGSVVGHVISHISDSQKQAEDLGISHAQMDNKMFEQTISVQSNEPCVEEDEKIAFVAAPKSNKLQTQDIQRLEASVRELQETIRYFTEKLKNT
ncbi:FHA domain-containing serine/threonine-protein kinase [Candidatus Uabimicrobium sp. HlEnr_7]|uniref:FHA domain-containing serine/threonine-protein kinase n=1 Tax=Candidatus Uabimicrobium helgolandensis TaxID=3095367 RepID=UPI0035568355